MLDWSELVIEDEADYRAAGLGRLLALSCGFLERAGVRFGVMPEGRGTARLASLLSWQVAERLELLDEACVASDQLVHFALHQMVDRRLGHDDPYAVLLAETIASASDLYLLGKLAATDREPAFLVDTMESFSAWFELYAGDPDDLERLLASTVADPYAAMRSLCRYLLAATAPLLYPRDERSVTDTLTKAARDRAYPLLHHYNTTNWVLSIRARYPRPAAPAEAVDLLAALPESEEGLYGALEEGS